MYMKRVYYRQFILFYGAQRNEMSKRAITAVIMHGIYSCSLPLRSIFSGSYYLYSI